jgi:hypothetical protein
LKPNGDSLKIQPNDLKITKHIQKLNGPSTPANKKKKKNQPSPHNKPCKRPSQKHNTLVKSKMNVIVKSKSSQKAATLAQKVEILDWHNNNSSNQTTTTSHFNKIYPDIALKQPLISAWVKAEAGIREQAKILLLDSKRI